jgi:hypothetical protein
MPMNFLRRTLRRLRQRSSQAPSHRGQQDFAHLDSQGIFTQIYTQRLWGCVPGDSQPFFSGLGSWDPQVVAPYVAAVRSALAAMPHKPHMVDLGCGDFQVGAQIRDACASYIACDIVEPLIEHNRKRYAHTGTDFRVLDLTRDALPAGDVACVRQVLQHLSNSEIAGSLAKLAATYRYLIVTEHLPLGSFVPNLDKPTGSGIRLFDGSGIDLTLPPFNLRVTALRRLCEAPQMGGVIRTFLYELPADRP